MAEDKLDTQNKAPDDKGAQRKGQGRASVPPASRSGTEGRPPKAPNPGEAKAGAKEIGGRKGPDPTRYGDWEQKGRCIDF